mgnify:CR=1 FL=1
MANLAIVFPGQGSQSVGMLADIATQFSEVQQTFVQASAVLGYDLWQLVQTGPAERKDVITLDKHLRLLTAHPKLRTLYLRMTDSIMNP